MLRLADASTVAQLAPRRPDAVCCADVCFLAGSSLALAAFYYGAGIFSLNAHTGAVQLWKHLGSEQRIMSIASSGGERVYACSRTADGACSVMLWDFVSGWVLGSWSCGGGGSSIAHAMCAVPLPGPNPMSVLIAACTMEHHEAATTTTHTRRETCFANVQLNSMMAATHDGDWPMVRIAHSAAEGIVDHGPVIWGFDARGCAHGEFCQGQLFTTTATTDDAAHAVALPLHEVHVRSVPPSATSQQPHCMRTGTQELWTQDGASGDLVRKAASSTGGCS